MSKAAAKVEESKEAKKKEEVEKKILELRNKLAEKQLRNADIYRLMRRYKAALIYYDIVLSKYYDSEYADDAQYGKALTYYEKEDWLNAKEQLLIFKEKFPDSEYLSAVEEMLREVMKIPDVEMRASN